MRPSGERSESTRNQGSASGQAFGLSQRGNDAELLHHAESIPIAVGIHDFSVGDVVDGDSINGYFLIRRWDSQVLAPLGARNGPAGNHFIFLGNGVLNGPMQVRVAFEEAQNLALVCFRANGGTRYVGSL